MRREQITTEHIDAVLEMAAETIYQPKRVEEIRQSNMDFPFIHALLWDSPEQVVEIFHTGSLAWDLERVAGISWKWHVSEEQEGLRIYFYENIPTKDKSHEAIEREKQLNLRVAEYLASVE